MHGKPSLLYDELFFSFRQGHGNPPPTAKASASPLRTVSEQHLHAALSPVGRTGRQLSVPLASRPPAIRFPTDVGPRRSRMVFFVPLVRLLHIPVTGRYALTALRQIAAPAVSA